MKKSNLFNSILIAFVAMMLPLQSMAYDFKVDGLCYNINSNGTSVTVTYEFDADSGHSDGYSVVSGDVVIPERVTYNGVEYSVTVIGDNAFRDCANLTSVSIPNSVTNIGNSAFSSCSGLLNVDIPNSVKTIGSWAFIWCTKLRTVALPNSVTEIGRSSFKACTNLTTATLGNSLTSIGDYAFETCTSLVNVDIPNTVTSIGIEAFKNCSKLLSTKNDNSGNLIIPSSVTMLGEGAFEYCGGFTGSLVIPNSITSIGNNTFFACFRLTGNLVIPNSVTSIGDNAFNSCRGFSGSLILPKYVTSIGKNAFVSCTGFSGNLIIPNTVTSIGDKAFDNCVGFTGYMVIPNSVTSIGNYALDCSHIKKIYSLITNPSSVTLGTRVFDIIDKNTCSLYVPSGKKSTYKAADQWKEFNIIYEMQGQHPYDIVFKDSQVKALCVQNWDSDNNGELSYDEAASVTNLGTVFKEKTNITSFDELQFFTGLTSINANAFDGCINLESIILPDRITTIGDYAFRGCSKLASTTYNANGSLVIPKLVNTIGSGAFQNCSGFTGNLSLPELVSSIGSYAFSGCSSLTGNLVLPNSLTSISLSAFNDCRGFTGDLEIPNSVTSIGISAFRECSGFNGTLTLPNSVTSIGNHAFYGCSGFTGELILPNSITSIDAYSFSGCSGFNGTLTIPNSVTSIGEYAFDSCIGFTSLVLPNSLNSIKGCAFQNCSGLTGELVIPNAVTSIGNSAFSGCNHLSSMTIPNSVTSIGNSAIACSGLEQIISQIEDVTAVALGTDVFYNVDKATCQLNVPEGTVDAYREADQWKDFLNIGDGVTKITDIAFNNDMLTTGVGTKIILEPVITPDDATYTTLTWASSDETVTTVDANGVVTALKPGVTTITATTTDGTNLSATCEVHVIGESTLVTVAMTSGSMISGTINEETLLPIYVKNEIGISSISFTIKFPERIELVGDLDSFIEATERGAGFDFTATQNDDGTITIAGTATAPLETGEGPVLNLKVKTAWQNTYTIPVTNMTVTTADGTVKQLPDSETKLVMQGTRGDMNGDGRVDLSDALYIINLATGLAE